MDEENNTTKQQQKLIKIFLISAFIHLSLIS